MSDSSLLSDLEKIVDEMYSIVKDVRYKLAHITEETARIHELHAQARSILNRFEQFQNIDDDDQKKKIKEIKK